VGVVAAVQNRAFHAAIAAGVPIIPVCVSGTSNKINLNRLKNGLVIVEMLPPSIPPVTVKIRFVNWPRIAMS
jgi:1-acyl-sn-glycerol-3-phosphate acyltransferase